MTGQSDSDERRQHPATGVVEEFFRHLTAQAWDHLAAVLDTGVERIGPYGDTVTGRDRYLGFLRRTVPSEYRNDVSAIVTDPEGRSGFARVVEHLRYGVQEHHLAEVYFFELGANGLITRIEIYWQTPGLDPGGLGSAAHLETDPSGR